MLGAASHTRLMARDTINEPGENWQLVTNEPIEFEK